MSETAPQIDPPPPARGPAAPEPGPLDPGPSNIQLIYIFYLLGFVVAITHLIAVVMAYVSRGKGEAWLDTHYTYQIRTFWIGLLYGIISAVLMLVFIGFVMMALVAVWVVLRCIKGLQAASRREPIPDPTTWMF